MNRLIPTAFLVLALSTASYGQPSQNADKKEIRQIMMDFMGCLVQKDSAKFFALFHGSSVTWVGAFKNKTQESRLKKDGTKKDYFLSTYQKFYRTISATGTDEEKFYNVVINNDEGVAAATFDYSFWENRKKMNWGKESWGLVKEDGRWKITSVIFSLEAENLHQEPQRSK